MSEVFELFGFAILTSEYYHRITDYTLQLQNELSISGNHSYQTDAAKSMDRYYEVCRQRDQYKAESEIASLKIESMKEIYETQISMLKSVIEDQQKMITDSKKAVEMVLRDENTGKIQSASGRSMKEQKRIILEKYANGYFDEGTDEEKRTFAEELAEELGIKVDTLKKYLREVSKEWKKTKVKIYNPDGDLYGNCTGYVYTTAIDRTTGKLIDDENWTVSDDYYSSIVALPA